MSLGFKFRLGKNVLKNRLGFKIPTKVTQHITYRCNLNCSYCNRENLESRELSTNKIFDMMDEFKKLGTLLWAFNGGEPLVREDILDLVQYAKSLNFYTILITNGWLVDKRKEALSFFDKIILSLDGPQRVNDLLRGKNSYKRALHAIKIFKELNKKIWILTVIQNSNLNYLSDMAEFAYKNDLGIIFQPLHNKTFKMKIIDFRNSINKLINLKEEGLPIIPSYRYLNILKNYWPSNNPIMCWAGKAYCNIAPNGFVFPCCNKLHLPETIDGAKIGYKSALKQISDYSTCGECFSYASMELNMLMNFNVGVIWDLLKK